MVEVQVINAFKELKIDISMINYDQTLDDHGIDSQEIIELHCFLEKIFNKKLPDGFIRKEQKIKELIVNFENFLDRKE